jgi:proteasome activator subunit 4
MEEEKKYQKPLVYNKHLPYADVIESEAVEKLSLIKKNLSVAVQKRDVTYGYIYWIRRLQSYITVYGMHFTKEDHLLFIKLAFELLTGCKTETHHIYSLVALINTLLKKRHLVSRDDLQLPWKPVYELYHEVFHSKGVKIGLKNFPRSIDSQIVQFVSYTRTYFPVEATQEILDEWRPKLCCFDMAFTEGTEVISRFIPVVMKAEEHHKGFKLWFDEMIHLWLDCFTDPRPDKNWLMLFTNIAFYNTGHIDWNPYLPEIFTRILRGFQLPMGSKQLAKGKHFSLLTDYHLIGNFVVSMMGGTSKAQEYLSQLMVSVDSYFHPSNTGAHTRLLESFISHLTNQFINRLYRERYEKPNWLPPTPDAFRLTEDDIDAFVDSILPAVKQCLFSKFGPMEATNIYQQLALLRPQKILPDLLEKMYAAFETLTEPHQLFATLQCVAVVGRPLLRDAENFPEGKSHLFPLLTLAIPGFDPNDYKKTLASAMLLSELITMVPLIDCSRTADSHNLSEMESELCSLTSQFEDFVVQLFDRCFLWIESSGLEQVALTDRQVGRTTKRFNHESLMSSGIVGTVSTILMQSSPSIAKVAIDRLFHFATTHVFESEVSGDAAAKMCGAASKYHPKLTLPLFVPHCIREISELLEDPEHMDTDTPDKTLLWKLQLLSKVLNAGGEELLPYAKDVLDYLSRCLRLTAVPVYESAASAVSSILQCLTQIYPMEGRSLNIDYSTSPQDHCYIRDWAVPGDIHNLSIQWHVPSHAELDLVDDVLTSILGPELDALQKFIEGEEMDRKELKRKLSIILAIIQGAAPYLPQFDGEQVTEEGWPVGKVSMKYGAVKCKAGAMSEREPPERFCRKSLAMFFDQLTEHICSTCEDDTKSIVCLAKILSCILADFGTTKQKVDQSFKSFQFTKKSLGDRLRKNKQHLRPVLISRVYLQHEQRMVEQGLHTMTALHHKLIKRLQTLSISAYPEVRMRSQEALSLVAKSYRFGIRSVVSDMPQYLRPDPNITHEQFKGALYILKMPVMASTYLHKLDLITQLLPAIITSGHSEKPSILSLVTEVETNIIKQATGYQLHFEVSDKAIALAASLGSQLSREELAEGEKYIQSLNKGRMKLYDDAVDKMVDLFENGNLTWRFAGFCIQFLGIILMHWQHPYPPKAVSIIVDCLVHDTLNVRKIAIKTFTNYLWLMKKPVKKIPLDFRTVAGTDKPVACVPGEREDNEWLLFDAKKVPKTSDEWNKFPFVDKSYIGYYTWAKNCTLYAPLDQQPRLTRSREEMSEGEIVVYDKFSSEEFVSKLFGYLSMEEKKGVDCFNKSRMEIFQRLSKVFGNSLLPQLVPHLQELAISSNENKQRCACEVIAGIVRGSKHWTFEMVKGLQDFLEPLLMRVLASITEETIGDWSVWASEVAADRDPHRIHWILELLADNPLKETNGTFKDFSQLCVLQTALAQQEWRIGRFHTDLFEKLRPHLGHPFKTVRDILGRVLMTGTMSNAGGSAMRHNLPVTTVVKGFFSSLPKPLDTVEYNLEEEDTKVQLRVFKTAVNWVLDLLPLGGLKLEYMPLLSAVLPLVNIEGDDELTGLLQEMFSFVSHAELPNGAVKGVMDMVQMAAESSSWKIRKPALHVLQVMVFGNLFKFAPFSQQLNDLLMKLMRDENVEVREVASDTVSGLMRCGLFTPTTAVQKHFKKLSRSKVAKRQSEESIDGPEDKSRMMERHAGVLGLAALVGSCPYSVPDWLPDILEELAGHLHDRAPIPATVKRAMNDFKRTHYDNWRDHKQKFTEDQLVILNDLLISPSYYA